MIHEELEQPHFNDVGHYGPTFRIVEPVFNFEDKKEMSDLEKLIESLAVSQPEPNQYTRDTCNKFVADFGEDEFKRISSVCTSHGFPINWAIGVFREFKAIDVRSAQEIEASKMKLAQVLADIGKETVLIVEFKEKDKLVPWPKPYQRGRFGKKK